MERASCPFYAAFRIVVQALNNSAIPVEEAYKILTDEKQNGHLVLLDAKAAFDKVIHSHLYHCFDDLTNYRQNCYSSIVDAIVFASDVKRCTLSYFASVSSSETMDRRG
jgi:hypothetical protein